MWYVVRSVNSFDTVVRSILILYPDTRLLIVWHIKMLLDYKYSPIVTVCSYHANRHGNVVPIKQGTVS